mgnify:FL=1
MQIKFVLFKKEITFFVFFLKKNLNNLKKLKLTLFESNLIILTLLSILFKRLKSLHN